MTPRLRRRVQGVQFGLGLAYPACEKIRAVAGRGGQQGMYGKTGDHREPQAPIIGLRLLSVNCRSPWHP